MAPQAWVLGSHGETRGAQGPPASRVVLRACGPGEVMVKETWPPQVMGNVGPASYTWGPQGYQGLG